MLERLRTDQRVALAEPLQDYAVQTTAPDPYAGVQAGNERMDITQAHRISRGRGVRIALIDTGLASDHPDLQGRIDVQRNFVDNDAKRFQLDRHGTAIAGVIAANADNGVGIAGVAPEARLLALKACWQLQDGQDDARCNTFTLAQALASAIELKAKIINLSLTGPPDPLLSALAEKARARRYHHRRTPTRRSLVSRQPQPCAGGRTLRRPQRRRRRAAGARSRSAHAGPWRTLRFFFRQLHCHRRDHGNHGVAAGARIGPGCGSSARAAECGHRHGGNGRRARRVRSMPVGHSQN